MLDLAGLNPPQRDAVLHGDGPLLVLAGAGSGKTRVLTYRVARLVERGWPARAICALSFTNRAADEMKERLAGLVGARDAAELTASTFHALGLAILKAHRPRFTIYDTADQLGVVREALRQIKIDDKTFDPRAILARISRAKNAFSAPPEGGDDLDAVTALVYPRYQQALAGFAAVDFDDLIVETVRLLDADAEARAAWSARFRHVLVDEYQDTNRAQMELLVRLLGDHHNVTVVGDDDQSIYSWRGAEAAHILEFERRFPGARVVKLEQNYRSTPTILAAANAVIQNNRVRHPKTLWSDRRAGDPIVLAVGVDADAEAKFVGDEIERLRLEDGRRYRDVAVLYRANVQSKPLEEALLARRLPFTMQGGQQFFERKEVKDVIAYLKLALNPRDEIALRRVINYPARGIGQTSLERCAAWAAARRVPLWDALLGAGEIVAGPPRAAVAGFVALIERTRAALATSTSGAAQDLVSAVGLYDDIRAAATTALAAQRRIDHVQDLLRSIKDREARAPGIDSLREYLHFLTLHTNDDDDREADTDRVTLTTLHGAKGLEWPVVFLVGVEEELLPHARTLYDDGETGAADVAEERRLAYVGITRARERLYLTRALARHKHGKERPRTPSRFLAEIPAELTTTRDLSAEARAPVAAQELRSFFQGFLK
jgi:DNA helicase-2/ATP-dependent DNA helicase PcrA